MNDATFQRTLQSVLFDNMYDRNVARRRTGKINNKGLQRISYSDKIFKRKEERMNKQYSIALLVDCSGSMNGDKMRIAANSALKLSRHLSSAKINHAVYGFNTPTLKLKDYNTAWDRDVEKKLWMMIRDLWCAWDRRGVTTLEEPEWCSEYGQYEIFSKGTSLKYIGHNLDLKNLKTLSLDDVLGTNRDIEHCGGAAWNNDSHAVRFVAKELHKQSGKKIMIVLSDGEPAGSYPYLQSAEFPRENYCGNLDRQNLKQHIKDIMKSGIEVHSIGIQSDAVNKFYPPDRTCSVYDLGQIYDHIIKIIRNNIKRG